MIAVIAGASGLVGSRVLARLLAHPRYTRVISVSRRPLPVNQARLVQVIVPDFSKLASHSAELQGDVYFCCLGTTMRAAGSRAAFEKVDYDAVVGFGKLAEQHGAKALLVVTALGASPRARVFYNRVKGRAEEALKQLRLPSLTLFQPGLLLGDRPEPRPGERFAIRSVRLLSSVVPHRVLSRIATDADALAEQMVQKGLAPEAGIQVIESRQL